MKEYGGYIELERYRGAEYHENALALNSGRHCVEYLIRAQKICKLFLPRFMCDSVRALGEKLGVEVELYRTDAQFAPIFDKELADDERLYVVNYYGQLSNDAFAEFARRCDGKIIVDYAQAFFQKPIRNVDALYSCRKFFGVSDGAYLYTKVRLNDELEEDVSFERATFLLGRFEKTASEFYSLYVANNELFANEPLKKMSKLTRNLLRGIDYERVERVRTENFAYLRERFADVNKLDLTIPEGAFMFPLYVENGAEIRKALQQKKIYVPTLWPDVFDVCAENDLEYDMAKNILPLPIDQRYGIDDMEFVANAVVKLL